VFDLIHDAVQFALVPAAEPRAEHLRDLMSRHARQGQIAAAFEDLVDGEAPLEDEV
jgi:hypothetical protein